MNRQTKNNAGSRAHNAALVLIGDEILSGKTRDSNGNFSAKKCFQHGIRLDEIRVIPDKHEVIVATLRSLISDYDFVFTSGGIGSTHDDITYLAIATTFGVDLMLDRDYAKGFIEYQRKKGRELSLESLIWNKSPLLKMATFPVGAKVLRTPGLWVPLVVVENVYAFPGIPQLFESMFENFISKTEGRPLTLVEVFTPHVEGDFAAQLAQIQGDFEAVSIGSYPKMPGEADYRAKITIEGDDAELVHQVANKVNDMLCALD